MTVALGPKVPSRGGSGQAGACGPSLGPPSPSTRRGPRGHPGCRLVRVIKPIYQQGTRGLEGTLSCASHGGGTRSAISVREGHPLGVTCVWEKPFQKSHLLSDA